MAMTDNELVAEMEKIQEEFSDDNESVHAEWDDLFCSVLESLGYEKAVAVFKAYPKWYA